MSDLLFRGRGAASRAPVPGVLLRLAGAALGVSVFTAAESLGFTNLTGLSAWSLRLLSLAAGALLAPTMLGSVLWLALGAFTAVLMLVMFTPVVRPAAEYFVRDDTAADRAVPLPKPDAIVVLSGDVSETGRVVGPALDRLLTGALDAKARSINAIALSSIALETGASRPTTEADQRALVALMAPAVGLHFVRDVHSTREEAEAFARLAREQHWTRLLLVTSPLHSRRACATFEAAGLSVECRPAVARSRDPRALGSTENRRLVFQDVIYELTATILYRARGWIR